MSQRSQLEDRYTVLCRGCQRESIEPNKRPGQKYPVKCPFCGMTGQENRRLLSRLGKMLSSLLDGSADYAAKRVGSIHEETPLHDGRSLCPTCGVVNDLDPKDPVVKEWHGDSFSDQIPV